MGGGCCDFEVTDLVQSLTGASRVEATPVSNNLLKQCVPCNSHHEAFAHHIRCGRALAHARGCD
eukprot:6448569-Amphidinium_carterae.1